jgi:hypothetical protein
MIRVKATVIMMRTPGSREKSGYPRTDTLPRVKRDKQAAGITLVTTLLPIKSSDCVMIIVLLSGKIPGHPDGLSITSFV